MQTGRRADTRLARGMSAPRLVVAPDSFKGSATARAAAQALRAGLQAALPAARIACVPMADGGEGTLDCIAARCGGRWRSVELRAIHGAPVAARWYRMDGGQTVIESAGVLGLGLIGHANAPPTHRRGSHALGMLLRAVLDSGARRIVIGLGGSACNDAGLGLLLALGASARDARGKRVAPTLAGLLALDALSLDGLDTRLAATEIDVLCDVDNPLLGERGASRAYGPQKGLRAADVDAAEHAFARLAACCNVAELTEAPGAGAAGGLGFALAVLGARLRPGAETLIRMIGLRATIEAADLVITGEGRSDNQTLAGKLPVTIARNATPKPAVLVSGAIDADARAALDSHFVRCYALAEFAGSAQAAMARPLHWLRVASRRLGCEVTSLAAR